MAFKMDKGGQIWLKCITGDLIMMIRDKNNIFERVENFHADLAWNYPIMLFQDILKSKLDPEKNRMVLVREFSWVLQISKETIYTIS